MTGAPAVTTAMEDYLKAIYELGGETGAVTTQRLADRLGVSCPSATNMMKKLARLELARYSPYRGVELTNAGSAIATRVLRHHDLVERFLWRTLAIPPDQGHDEAERLEHHISGQLGSRIEASLGSARSSAESTPGAE